MAGNASRIAVLAAALAGCSVNTEGTGRPDAGGAGSSGNAGGSDTGGAGPGGSGASGGSGGSGAIGTGGAGAAGAGGSSGAGSGGNGTGGAAGSSFAAEPIASPPSYSGSLDNSAACSQRYATAGFAPADPSGAKHPLFLYFVGTVFVPTEANSWRDGGAPRAVTEAMARRGFVALSVQYDNGPFAWLSDHGNQLACLFAPAHAESLLAAACSLGPVDCSLGIGVWGHSQGGLVADMAANYDPRVRTAWTTGYGGDARATLSKNRLRVVNGESDTTNGTVPVLNEIAGFTSAECPLTNKQCLRSDGSGWIIVQTKDVVTSSADHCWFDKRSCTDATETLEPNWIDPASVKPFALSTNADWVAETARRP